MAYVELDDLKAWLRFDDEVDDAILQTCANAASRGVDTFCGRQFTLSSGTSARVYYPHDASVVKTDDFAYTSNLSVSVDTTGDGTFETSLTLDTDYFAAPVNRDYASTSGAPYFTLHAVGRCWPNSWYGRPTVQVTAQWGWTEVPEEVVQATKLKAARLYRRMHTPEGIYGGAEFGAIRLSMKEDADVCLLLSDYRKGGEAAGLVVA